jgi:uncharacterized protein (DUF2237 family)
VHPSLNALGGPLVSCSHEPLTGWYRDGCCNTDDNDRGSHTVCAQVTTEFLAYIREQGNDLVTPHPEHGFPGLKDGDTWCVCAASWLKAYEAGVACPVKIEATHALALEVVPLSKLIELSIAAEA